ncbi:MAG TPA: M48 family metalloprotease, partial [Phycisphaerae bacterium]
MIPITFIILLIVVSLPGQIVANDHSSLNSLPQGPHAWVYLVSLVVWQLAVSFFVLFRTRKIVHQMHDSAAGSGDVANRADTLFGRARWATIVITAVHLATPLTRWILGHFQPLEILTAALVPELIFITPALLAWLVIWTASYFVEDAARQRALPFRLQQRLPVHEMPGLGSFLALQARHNFFPVVLVIVGAVVNVISTAVSRRFPDANDPRAAAATIAGTVVMFLILPFILVKVWSTTPMVGQLRTRLDLVAARYGLRFRNILLWRTHNLVMNAAILGWFPFARYFLLSDSLLEAFNDQQLESVFAHEVGHGIHRHLH